MNSGLILGIPARFPQSKNLLSLFFFILPMHIVASFFYYKYTGHVWREYDGKVNSL